MASLVVWWHASQYTMRYLHMWMNVLNVLNVLGGVLYFGLRGMGWDVGREVGGEMVCLLCVVGEVLEIGLGRDCVIRMSVCMCVCLSVDGAFLISDIWICVLAQSIHHTTSHTTHSHREGIWCCLDFPSLCWFCEKS